jgi:MFS family permease
MTEYHRLPAPQPNTVSVRALEWTNFFLADVQAGLGPFVAAYLASLGWRAGAVGGALTFGGIITVVLQTPAGAIVDGASHKRLILVVGTLVLACGAILLAVDGHLVNVYAAESLIGLAAPFLGPTIAAITMGVVGPKLFDLQFGRNQGFNAAGNLFAAAVIALVSHALGNRAIFFSAAALTLPTIAAALLIRKDDINLDLARGSRSNDSQLSSVKRIRFQTIGPEIWDPSILRLVRDRVLLTFLICAFLFHFANAAMLPELGELLARGSARTAAPFMSACVAITQLVILMTAAYFGRFAHQHGRKRLLLWGFGLLPVRAVLYTLFHAVPALLAVQILDGIANSIFGVVSILIIADRSRGSGRFNLSQGALATAVGLGAALSNSFGGILMQRSGYRVSFIALGIVAGLAFLLLLLVIPETTTQMNSEVQPANT